MTTKPRLVIPADEEFLASAQRCADLHDLPLASWARMRLKEAIRNEIKPLLRQDRQDAADQYRLNSRVERAEKQAIAAEEKAARLAKRAAREEMARMVLYNREVKPLTGLMAHWAHDKAFLPDVFDVTGKNHHPWRFVPEWEVTEDMVRAEDFEISPWMPDGLVSPVVVVENSDYIGYFNATYQVDLDAFRPHCLSERIRYVFTPEMHDTEGVDFKFVRIPTGTSASDIAAEVHEDLWEPIGHRRGKDLAAWLMERREWARESGKGLVDNYRLQNSIYIGRLPEPMKGGVPRWAEMRLGLDG